MTAHIVTVRMTVDIEVEVDSDRPSDAIASATQSVDENGYSAGDVVFVTTDTERVRRADDTLDADLLSHIDLSAAVNAAPGESWRWTIQPYLSRQDNAPAARDLRWRQVLDALDEWAAEHPAAVPT